MPKCYSTSVYTQTNSDVETAEPNPGQLATLSKSRVAQSELNPRPRLVLFCAAGSQLAAT